MRLVPVVRLIAFGFPGAGLLTTTMEHRGGRDNGDGALPWLRGGPGPRGAGAGGAGAAAGARSPAGPPAGPGLASRLTREKPHPCHIEPASAPARPLQGPCGTASRGREDASYSTSQYCHDHFPHPLRITKPR